MTAEELSKYLLSLKIKEASLEVSKVTLLTDTATFFRQEKERIKAQNKERYF
jgi:hypothetical protein